MLLKFAAGTKMFWKHNNQPAYEKLGNNECDWWVALSSTYVVEKELLVNGKKTIEYEVHPENEKPLYDNKGKLNRFGFKLPDEQVFNYYDNIMDFVMAHNTNG